MATLGSSNGFYKSRRPHCIPKSATNTSPAGVLDMRLLRTPRMAQPEMEAERDAWIHKQVFMDIQSDPVQLAEFRSQWARAISIQSWAEFRQSKEYKSKFETFYNNRRASNPAATPIDYEFFESLSSAYPKGEQAFLETVRSHYEDASGSIEHQRHDFETATQLDLAREWWTTSHVADWVRDHARQDGPKVLESIAAWGEHALASLFRVPIQVATALMLSIFILVEWRGLKAGVADLRKTRLQPVVDEILPGVVALGKLIGKSFQGQVVIAAANAMLTLIALWIIGVEYKFILGMLVFVFSFIPVVGVILSAFPIARSPSRNPVVRC